MEQCVDAMGTLRADLDIPIEEVEPTFADVVNRARKLRVNVLSNKLYEDDELLFLTAKREMLGAAGMESDANKLVLMWVGMAEYLKKNNANNKNAISRLKEIMPLRKKKLQNILNASKVKAKNGEQSDRYVQNIVREEFNKYNAFKTFLVRYTTKLKKQEKNRDAELIREFLIWVRSQTNMYVIE